ncbi:peroxiredoxin [Sphingomonas naasensis]|uniref:Redoxin domain-containing protein n=1 Tax=Sphingomonas naasensis TaxID=1344951 RepID=A0A4S1WBB5_9SPHN|nr:redoxin domain-containing protein [Sphingomonas naasensis]NIJ19520.1 peroxiredoxin [Sphingomonas naasensis]TGX39255.1 redoxin domain-containing protein [Sphingomonas naasensis]
MTRWIFAGLAAVCVSSAAPLAAEPGIGAAVPNFRAYDMHGKIVDLSQYRGKTVVLEWNNPGCPFVQKHYQSGNMQKSQAAAVAQGAVWLTINSGPPGKQGHMSGVEAQKFVADQHAAPSAYLLDPQGLIGKGFGAKTTPHMYVIDGDGRLAYNGAIDDKPTADKADIAGARNHVLAALGEMRAGKPVSVPESRPYGCSVKYAA